MGCDDDSKKAIAKKPSPAPRERWPPRKRWTGEGVGRIEEDWGE